MIYNYNDRKEEHRYPEQELKFDGLHCRNVIASNFDSTYY